jgi:hypothetical protein
MNIRLTSAPNRAAPPADSVASHGPPSRASKKIGKKKPREFQG